VPDAGYKPLRQEGLASWYGKRFHGKATATGELYDMYAMTAAHPTLPVPSYARVTALDSGKSVVVRVNDRGPFHSDRVIDLSYAAAYKLGITANGSGRVSVEAIDPGSIGGGEDFVARGLFVQLGAFGARANADSLYARARTQLADLSYKLRLHQRDGMWRVALGPFDAEDQASDAVLAAGERMQLKPFKVRY
jgi:rare lipoprotein A